MTKEEIMTYIYTKRNSDSKVANLDRMKSLMNELGNPQDKLKFIHIAGTNGKGSTTTMMANVLKKSGYVVGKYISPYIICFNERIQVNNEFITDEELTFYIEKLSPIIDKMDSENNAPAFFEIITAIAFMYFLDKKCDIVCLEVGVGGVYDPTNIITTTIISIITLIDFDHTSLLGDTISEIAENKCGIIKKDKLTVTYPKQNPEALTTIRKFCKENNNKLYVPSLKLLDIIKCNHNINYFSYKGAYYKLNLIGEYQIYNALMVIVASNLLINLGYKISFSAINTGIYDTQFPARLEKISDNPLTFIDGSHNISGAKSLKSFLYEYKGKKNYALMAFTKGKDCEGFIKELSPYFQEILFVKYENNYRFPEDVETLLEIAKANNINARCFNSIKEAYEYIKTISNIDLLISTGSLYFASHVRNFFNSL